MATSSVRNPIARAPRKVSFDVGESGPSGRHRGVVIEAVKASPCSMHSARISVRRSRLSAAASILESLYEACVTFNIKYCPYRCSMANNRSHLIIAGKNILILLCFLLANIFVLQIVVSRIIVHTALLFMDVFKITTRPLFTIWFIFWCSRGANGSRRAINAKSVVMVWYV